MGNEEFIAELRIFSKDDRKTVAAILFENGYTVRQGKKKRTETGKSVDYTVIVTDRNGETADRLEVLRLPFPDSRRVR